MNALAPRSGFPLQGTTSSADLCFHCGHPVPSASTNRVMFDGRYRSTCCVGCASVVEAIADAGLGDYYRHRIGYAAAPPRVETTTRANGSTDAAATTTVTCFLTAMHCAACVWLTERALGTLPGVLSSEVNFASRQVKVSFDPSQSSAVSIIAKLNQVGLGAEQISDKTLAEARALRARSRKREWIAFGIAALCMMQVMMLVVPLYLAAPGELERESARLMSWAAWLITLPVLLISARSILKRMWSEVCALDFRALSMDTPIGIALVTTFAASTWALVVGEGRHYFDAISMFVTLILGARLIESGLRNKTLDTIERLSNARPLTAAKLANYPSDLTAEQVLAGDLALGDIIHIGVGDAIAADCVIEVGESEIEESLLTGESHPVLRKQGDSLLAGAINRHSPLIARVTAVGEHTVAATMARKVEANLLLRPATASTADVFARWLAPLTIVASALTFFVWSLFGQGAQNALDAAVAVLVVTCPCALALALPTVQAASLAQMMRSGLLITRVHVIETLADATDVVFDKTGTLTTGRMRVESMVISPSADPVRVCAVVVAMEAGSNHPIGKALSAACKTQSTTNSLGSAQLSITARAGLGLEAAIDGACYRLGVPRWALGETMVGGDEPADVTEIALTMRGHEGTNPVVELARFRLSDTLREEATRAIAQLQHMGLRVHICSGDATPVVNACAKRLGVETPRAHGRQTPPDKQSLIASLRADGAVVVAIGDGTNDAQMLSGAQVGIGLSTGTALTKLSSDAVLSTDRQHVLNSIVDAVATARRAKVAVKQNLYWATGYNLIAIPFAAMGIITPLWAAAGMALSSLLVVINAARLARPSAGAR